LADNPPQLPPDLPGGWPPGPSVSSVADAVKKQHADTASKLAGRLIWILAGGIVLHYLCVTVLSWLKHDDAVKVIEDAYHQWLPTVAGLAGGAVTYYFTREGK